MATTHVGSVYWDASLKGVQQVQRQLKDLQRQIDALRPKSGQSILGQIFGGAKGLAGIGTILSSVSRMFTRLGDTLTHFGQITSVFSYRLSILVAGLAAFGVKIGKVSADFEENLAFIGTQLDRGEVNIEEFTTETRDHIRNLSKWIPKDINDIAKAMYYLVSSLSIPPETAREMLEPISMAATAGRATAEATTKAGTVILNVYDHILESADGTLRLVREGTEGAVDITEASADKVRQAVEQMYNLLTLAVEKGTAEFGDFTVQLGDFALEAELAGVSLEELLAIYAAATRVTTPAMAATWVSNIFRRFTDPNFFEGLRSYGIEIKNIEEGTGRWVTVERTLSEAQQDRVTTLNQTIIKAQARYNEYIADAVSTWDDYTAALKRYEETGYITPGFNVASLSSYYTLINAQEDLAEIMAAGTGAYRKWVGELRPGVDMLVELAEAISNVEDEERQRQIVHDLFPSARAQRGFLAYLKGLKDINEWQEEWRGNTENLREDFEDMADTVNSRATLLWNNIKVLGDTFYEAYEEDIKRFIGGLTEIVDLFFKLDPLLARQIALWGFLLVSLAPIMLLIGTISIGLGTLVTAIGMLISPTVLAPAIVLFAIFGDKLKDAWGALSKYGISDMKDIVQFFMDLAIQLGIISEADAERILIAFGIPLKQMGDPAVLKFIDAFRGMVDRIVTVKDDLVEWFDAFRLLLEDIEKRQGAIGTIVGYIERLAAIITPIIGAGVQAVTPPGQEIAPVRTYEQLGPPEKRDILERSIISTLAGTAVGAVLGFLGAGPLGAKAGGVIGGGVAAYALTHEEEIGKFFNETLPNWWNDKAYPVINTFFMETFPAWWNDKIYGPVVGFFTETLPTWFTENFLPSVTTFFTATLPTWFSENFLTPVTTFFTETLPTWFTDKALPTFTEFFTATLPQWFTDKALPAITTFLTTTLPEKIGYAVGYALGTGGVIAVLIGNWLATEAIPELVLWGTKLSIKFAAWLTGEALPAIYTFFTETLPTWLKEEFLPWLLTEVIPAIFKFWTETLPLWLVDEFLPAVITIMEKFWWEILVKVWESFLAGVRQGFIDAVRTGLGLGPAEKPAEGEEGEPKQFGGIMGRTARVLAHKGEVFFNPRYPRQDLARVVNAAMAKVGGGGELAPVTVTANVNIGTFAGTQTEMNQLQRMLENMSFDMAMRVERKLAEARRVESRRRE